MGLSGVEWGGVGLGRRGGVGHALGCFAGCFGMHCLTVKLKPPRNGPLSGTGRGRVGAG